MQRCNETEFDQMPKMDMNFGNYGNACPPIYECPQQQVCERYIIHDVPHIVPVVTKYVNHHIYRHSYTPCFTSEECDTCENVYADPCSKMM